MEGEGYRQISGDGCAVDILDDPTESDGGIVLGRVDGVDGMRICLGNRGKEVKVAGCQGCGGVDNSAYSRVVGITKLRAELENDVGEGQTDWNGRVRRWGALFVARTCGASQAGTVSM